MTKSCGSGHKQTPSKVRISSQHVQCNSLLLIELFCVTLIYMTYGFKAHYAIRSCNEFDAVKSSAIRKSKMPRRLIAEVCLRISAAATPDHVIGSTTNQRALCCTFFLFWVKPQSSIEKALLQQQRLSQELFPSKNVTFAGKTSVWKMRGEKRAGGLFWASRRLIYHVYKRYLSTYYLSLRFTWVKHDFDRSFVLKILQDYYIHIFSYLKW